MSKPGPKATHLHLVDATEEASSTVDEPRSCGGRTKLGSACKKPAGQGTEHPGVGQCRYHDGQVEPGSPCPLPLTPLEAHLWDDTVAQLQSLRLYNPAYWRHIYCLVTAMAGLYTAKQSAAAGATVKGDNSHTKKHPSSTIVNQMLALIRQFSNDLGLSPSALQAMDLGEDPSKPRSKMEGFIKGRR